VSSDQDEALAYAIAIIGRELGRRERWQRDAACIGHPEVSFFPERGVSTRPARAVCARCLVRDDCLGYAMAHGIKHGIWGGLSERERRRLRRERVLAA
jgi:WhiB family redox-sensing transcriptional regulator